MKAAVTQGRATMQILDVADAGEPGAGEVLVRPEAVGLCGSDFHYFLGDLGDALGPDLYPRVQGHEAAGVVEAVGPDCPPELRPGERVAIWPLTSCGRCYPCRIGRENACVNISLIGIHRDGALQERLRVPASQVFAVGAQDAALAALIEPVSIAVRAVARGRVAAGEKVVVFGAGPIGQAVAAATIDRGASVLLVDPLASRLEHGRTDGRRAARARRRRGPGRGGARVGGRRRSGGGLRSDRRARGRARRPSSSWRRRGASIVVGLSGHDAPLPVGDLAFKEIDVLGVSCCNGDEFAEAVALVDRRQDALAGLVTHEFSLEETPAAIEYAIGHPTEVMKAMIRLEES